MTSLLKKHNITDINQVRTWSEEKYDNLMEKLTEIIEDGLRADEKIKDKKMKKILQHYSIT